VNRWKAMSLRRLIRLLKMNFRMLKLCLLAALLAACGLFTGCATNESDNASVRPWNSPQGWENGLGGMDTQHR
jgi:hypothetical protein